MKTIYEKYMASPIDKELLCLEHGEITEPYFCYPVNAEPIGFEGCILYCFLPEYGEMVFACDPESCADRNVYPLAKNFEDFLRLILACGTADPVEQIVWMDKLEFIYLILRNPCIFKENRHFNTRSLCIFPCFCPYEPKQGKVFV